MKHKYVKTLIIEDINLTYDLFHDLALVFHIGWGCEITIGQMNIL